MLGFVSVVVVVGGLGSEMLWRVKLWVAEDSYKDSRSYSYSCLQLHSYSHSRSASPTTLTKTPTTNSVSEQALEASFHTAASSQSKKPNADSAESYSDTKVFAVVKTLIVSESFAYFGDVVVRRVFVVQWCALISLKTVMTLMPIHRFSWNSMKRDYTVKRYQGNSTSIPQYPDSIHTTPTDLSNIYPIVPILQNKMDQWIQLINDKVFRQSLFEVGGESGKMFRDVWLILVRLFGFQWLRRLLVVVVVVAVLDKIADMMVVGSLKTVDAAADDDVDDIAAENDIHSSQPIHRPTRSK